MHSIILPILASPALAIEDQWRDSTSTMADLVAQGYEVRSMAVVRVTPFDHSEHIFILQKGPSVYRCLEAITSKQGAIVSKSMSCAQLVEPFSR